MPRTRKYFTWSAAATTKILAAPTDPNKKLRIVAVVLSCNEETAVAIVHEGATPPGNGDAGIIDFVDSVRLHNESPLPAPYVTEPGNPIFLTTTDALGTTSGRGMIVYLETTA